MRDAHHYSGPSVSEMTYTVSSGTLNSTIPYHKYLQWAKAQVSNPSLRALLIAAVNVMFQLVAKSMNASNQEELENRLRALTESLIQKQTALESLSTEKNSLIMQMERLEVLLHRILSFIVLLFIRAPFYVLLVFIATCSVFWLFCLSYQYLPSDWLERLL